MGEYNSNWFSFEVKSQRHIMDLIIEPSFAKAICFQVHGMKDGSFKLFWNFGMVGREIDSLIKKYIEINKISVFTLQILVSKEFGDFMRANATQIQIADLDADDMTLANAVVNAKWIEAKRRYGLDGHSYKIKIYGKPIREYEFYCDIYEEQKELIPFVDRLIEIAKLESDRIHYEVHSIYSADGVECKKIHPLNAGKIKKIHSLSAVKIPEWFNQS